MQGVEGEPTKACNARAIRAGFQQFARDEPLKLQLVVLRSLKLKTITLGSQAFLRESGPCEKVNPPWRKLKPLC